MHTSSRPVPIYIYIYILRSEEHTSELQSPCNLVCRLLLEKKKILVRLHTAGSTPPPLPFSFLRSALVRSRGASFGRLAIALNLTWSLVSSILSLCLRCWTL